MVNHILIFQDTPLRAQILCQTINEAGGTTRKPGGMNKINTSTNKETRKTTNRNARNEKVNASTDLPVTLGLEASLCS